MFTYKVDMPDKSFQIIEADYFMMGPGQYGSDCAYFYVKDKTELDGGTVTRDVLVAFVRSPVLIKFDDHWEYVPDKPEVVIPVSGYTKAAEDALREVLRKERDKVMFTFPGEPTLDRAYDLT